MLFTAKQRNPRYIWGEDEDIKEEDFPYDESLGKHTITLLLNPATPSYELNSLPRITRHYGHPGGEHLLLSFWANQSRSLEQWAR